MGLEQAIKFTREKHTGQKRHDGKPYITHPMEVMRLLERVTDDEEILCAAVLHDVVEECGVQPKELEFKFGKRVASIVTELSKNHTDPSKIKSREALLIKMADALHNATLVGDSEVEYLIKGRDMIRKVFFGE